MAASADGGGRDAEATEPAAVESLLTNPGFEELDADGWPLDWHPMWESSPEAFWVDDAEASEGERSMRVLDEDDTRGYAIRADPIAVSAGDTYRLALDLNFNSGTLQPSVIFLDDADERVSLEWERVEPGTGTWSRYGFHVTVPDGATQAQVLIDTTAGGVADGWVDNVSFTAAEPDEVAGEEENLGEPIAGITNAGAGYTEDANGRDIGLVVAGGSPSRFSAVDLVTGERLMTQVIEASTQTWAYATTPDRNVYVATSSGEVFRFDPDELTLTRIANQPFGETYFWEGQSNADGDVFFATYPGGKLLRYEPAADEWTDFGTLIEGNTYARSLAVDGTDVYVGLGTAEPAVVHVDATTGDTTRIDLPEGYEDQQYVHDTSVAGDTLLARLTPANDILVYSLTEEAWVDTIPGAVGNEVSPAVQTSDSGTERTEVLIPEIGGGMIAYDLDTREQRSVSIDLGGGAARGWSVQEVDLEGFPGQSLVTATSKAVFHVWNPQTGETRSVRSDASPTPFLIRTIDNTDEGEVWVGGYASPPGAARVDAALGTTEFLSGMGQVEGLTGHGQFVIMGTYPGANIYTYDTTQPWVSGGNPEGSISIGHGQDRPVVLESVDDAVAIGTVPVGGELGGALTFFDPMTGGMDVVEEPVEDQTVISLAYRDGLLYGGTGIWGGLGADPTTTEGQLFVYDVENREVVHQAVPAAGDQNVSALTFDPEGNLWGLTSNHIFRFDPDTREIVERTRILNVNDSAAYWTTRDLEWHDGKLVGQASGELFEFYPQTMTKEVVQTGGQNLGIDEFGNYYYNRGGVLYRWVSDPEVVEVTPEAVTFTDEDGTEDDSYTVPEVEGVEYLVDGEVIEAGTYPGEGTVTVTARAAQGYELAEGAAAEWRHTFDATEPEPEPEPPALRYGFFLNNGWDGVPEHVFQYGRHADEVLIGDWDGDGTDSITIRRGHVYHVSNEPRGGEAEHVFHYGREGDVVLVGDWDGDGVDTLAVRRDNQYHVKNFLRGGQADQVIVYGRAGDEVLVGDWDANATDTFTVRRGAEYHVRNAMAGGEADRTFVYGREGDITLAGDWDGDGTDTFAIRRGKEYHVKNSLAGGPADFTQSYGRAGDQVLVGDWNGDGRDTLGVRRTA